jgi:L-alanine-DL-glutamate epimerase-like enolase superfamily enzyme
VDNDVIRDVTVRSVVVPLRRPLATKVGDFARWPLLLIDVTTEQGITGRLPAPLAARALTVGRCWRQVVLHGPDDLTEQ